MDTGDTAEQKIKTAAKKLFTQKGYAAVKTRDIASEAGINLALVNYYFRSKENLFEIVMLENMTTFAEGAAEIIHNESTSLDQKIELLVGHYIDVLIKNPNVPQFVLNEMQSHPEKITAILGQKLNVFNSSLIRQVGEEIQLGKMINIAHPVQFMVNLLALTIFPFISKAMLTSIGNVTDMTFSMMMESRKQLIPIWIKAMYKNESGERKSEERGEMINKTMINDQ